LDLLDPSHCPLEAFSVSHVKNDYKRVVLLEVALGEVVKTFLACCVSELNVERLVVDIDLHLKRVVVAKSGYSSVLVLQFSLYEAAEKGGLAHLMIADHSYSDGPVAEVGL